MKKLLLLRHAKSSWSDDGLPDHDRPLNKRGKKTAPQMGRLLVERDLVPDLIVSSSAKRARKTAEAVAKAARRFAARDGSKLAEIDELDLIPEGPFERVFQP